MKTSNKYIYILFAILISVFYSCDSDSFSSPSNQKVPSITFTTDPGTYIAPGVQVTFNDNSTNTPTSWQWDMPGATPNTSNQQNPSVVYENEGVFSVTLTATNAYGSTQIVYENYIEISVLAIPEDVLLNFENNLTNEGSAFINASLDPISTGTELYGTSFDNSGSYVFDGTNPLHIDGFKGITGSTPRTIALWLKADPGVTIGGAGFGLVSWGASGTGTRYSFKEQPNGVLRIEWQGGGLNGTIPVNDNNWHHVAVTWDETTIRLYVDGVLDTTSNPTIINTDGSLNVEIGTYRQNASFNFVGEMDNVIIDDVAYTPEKIKSIFEGN
ncbi:LamG-like jellyroll fold domain-containing protein [uncultured Wocania sp.]|uniref:LamG-like jellyroll fold domain-containing protein n=1 Tax=uncultured Wocania sp. TaxID=2834404 RepID=UPI0030FC4B37